MRTEVNFNYQSANEAGETRHAKTVMEELAEKQGFTITRSEPFTIGDCWIFELDHDLPLSLPDYIRVLDPIDRTKPTITKDQFLCSGCWAVADRKVTGWIYTRFNHLDPVILCPDCQYKFGDDFDKMLKAGL